jgi:hypothetical protein
MLALSSQFSIGDLWSMTPQWRGLFNGSVIYLVLGVVALACSTFISKTNKPWVLFLVVLRVSVLQCVFLFVLQFWALSASVCANMCGMRVARCATDTKYMHSSNRRLLSKVSATKQTPENGVFSAVHSVGLLARQQRERERERERDWESQLYIPLCSAK